LADVRVCGAGIELPFCSGPTREGDRQAASAAGGRDRRERLAIVAERHRDVIGLGLECDLAGERAALAGEPERRKCRLADDHRMNEFDGNVAGVRTRGRRVAKSHQAATACESLGHPVTQTCDAFGLLREEGPAGLFAIARQVVDPFAEALRGAC
jgi:hypothetical protein